MIGLIDYGASNLASVGNALDYLGCAWTLCMTPESLQRCERLILPGVGHFGSAIGALRERELLEPLRTTALAGRPLLGLCLGAQLLLECSEEAPDVAGLGLVPGRVVRLRTRTVPHMGWNRVTARGNGRLITAGESPYYYFAHSFFCEPREAQDVAGVAEHESVEICAAVQHGPLFGVQFHPEKSGPAGLDLLRRFATC